MRRKSSTKDRVLAILAGFVFLAALLIPVEFWARRKWPARASAAESTNDFDYFHLEIHQDFFKLERKFGVIPWRYRTQRPRAGGVQYFDAVKKPGVTRVFVIGGSVAMGFNAQEMSRLGEFLRRSLPGREFELVGCGMGGYDSWRVGLVEEEVLRHQPDLIVVLSGNNEYASRVHFNPYLIRLNRVLRESRLFQKLQDSYRPGMKEAPWPLEDRLRNYESNLRLMAARARRRNVPIVFCTLPVNIRDVTPVFSPAPTDHAAYFRARAALDRGRAREAAREFSAYSSAHPREPWGYYELGKALDMEGAAAQARLAYLSAVDWDDPGDRCSPRRNAIIRGLANQDGVAVADVEEAFSRAVPDGLMDSRLFKDDVHWYDEYYPLVSLTIVKAIADHDRTAARPLLAPAGDWVRWWTPGFERELAHPAMDAGRRARYADEIFLTAVAQVFRVNGQGFQECGCSYFQMAERMRPGIMRRYLSSPAAVIERVDASPWLGYVQNRIRNEWPRVLLHAGEACRLMGRLAEARVYLDESLRSAPKDAYARLFRGILERSLGKDAAAAADLRQAALSRIPGVAAWAAAER